MTADAINAENKNWKKIYSKANELLGACSEKDEELKGFALGCIAQSSPYVFALQLSTITFNHIALLMLASPDVSLERKQQINIARLALSVGENPIKSLIITGNDPFYHLRKMGKFELAAHLVSQGLSIVDGYGTNEQMQENQNLNPTTAGKAAVGVRFTAAGGTIVKTCSQWSSIVANNKKYSQGAVGVWNGMVKSIGAKGLTIGLKNNKGIVSMLGAEKASIGIVFEYSGDAFNWVSKKAFQKDWSVGYGFRKTNHTLKSIGSGIGTSSLAIWAASGATGAAIPVGIYKGVDWIIGWQKINADQYCKERNYEAARCNLKRYISWSYFSSFGFSDLTPYYRQHQKIDCMEQRDAENFLELINAADKILIEDTGILAAAVLAGDPNDIFALQMRATGNLNLNNYQLVLDDMDVVLAGDPSDTFALQMRARANCHLNNYQLVLNDVTTVLPLLFGMLDALPENDAENRATNINETIDRIIALYRGAVYSIHNDIIKHAAQSPKVNSEKATKSWLGRFFSENKSNAVGFNNINEAQERIAPLERKLAELNAFAERVGLQALLGDTRLLHKRILCLLQNHTNKFSDLKRLASFILNQKNNDIFALRMRAIASFNLNKTAPAVTDITTLLLSLFIKRGNIDSNAENSAEINAQLTAQIDTYKPLYTQFIKKRFIEIDHLCSSEEHEAARLSAQGLIAHLDQLTAHHNELELTEFANTSRCLERKATGFAAMKAGNFVLAHTIANELAQRYPDEADSVNLHVSSYLSEIKNEKKNKNIDFSIIENNLRLAQALINGQLRRSTLELPGAIRNTSLYWKEQVANEMFECFCLNLIHEENYEDLLNTLVGRLVEKPKCKFTHLLITSMGYGFILPYFSKNQSAPGASLSSSNSDLKTKLLTNSKSLSAIKITLYRDDDVNLLVNGYINSLGGVTHINSTLLQKQFLENSAQEQGHKNPLYHVAVLASAQTGHKFKKINREHELAPDFGRRDDRRDVFTDLMPELKKSSESYAKILFPLNISNVHWILVEIIIHRSGNQYQVEIYGHDSMKNRGKISDIDYDNLRADITHRISDEYPLAAFTFSQKESPYKRSQFDGNSCGVIVADSLIKRIQGTSLDMDSPYPNGAIKLRKNQLEFVLKNTQITDTDKRNFFKRNVTNSHHYNWRNFLLNKKTSQEISTKTTSTSVQPCDDEGVVYSSSDSDTEKNVPSTSANPFGT